MIKVIYRPEDVGKVVINSHGKLSKIRKYHMTDEEIPIMRDRWEKSIIDVNEDIKELAGDYFFNPYRSGIYYYQIQSLYLLGANKWHSFNKILTKMELIMSLESFCKNGMKTTFWEKFKNKRNRENAAKCKDYIGRIQENMIFFQRLSRLHPCGYKLRQVRAAVDIKRTTKEGFLNGRYFYRLSTYSTEKEALPIRDFSNFVFPRHEKKYINYNFIGTIITPNKVIYGKGFDDMP